MHPFDDPHVIAGQGTLAFEILEQAPDAETILVPVGGGRSFLAGVATVLRALKPDLREIIGVEPARTACLPPGSARRAPVRVPTRFTLAEKGGVVLSGKTNSVLTLSNVAVADQGIYSVAVLSGCQNVTNSATLTVNANTLVTIPPANATELPGFAGELPRERDGNEPRVSVV